MQKHHRTSNSLYYIICRNIGNSMTKYVTRRRPVFCMNCGHEFISRVEHPHCSKCASSQIVDSKEVPVEISATMLRTEVKQSIKELKGKEIQQLLNGYFHLAENMEKVDEALKNYAKKMKEQDQRIEKLERKIRTAMI